MPLLQAARHRIPVAGRIRAGIKVLTRRAAGTSACAIYEARRRTGQELRQHRAGEIADAVPDLKNPLAKRTSTSRCVGRTSRIGDRAADHGCFRRRPGRRGEAAVPVPGGLSGRCVAVGDARMNWWRGRPTSDASGRVRRGQPDPLLHESRARAGGQRHAPGHPRLGRSQDHAPRRQRRPVRSRILRRVPRTERCAPVGAVHLLHPGIQVDQRLRAADQQLLRDERRDPEVPDHRLHAGRPNLRLPGRQAHAVLPDQAAGQVAPDRRGGPACAHLAVADRTRGAGRRGGAAAAR